MEYGNYKRKLNFDKLRIKKFSPTIYDPVVYSSVGCGASCLSMITGKSPLDFVNKSGHYSDNKMIKTLRKHGISCYKITVGKLSNTDIPKYQLDERHIVLSSIFLQKGVCSWVIFSMSHIFHNFEINKMTNSRLINFPIYSSWLLYKDSWAK